MGPRRCAQTPSETLAKEAERRPWFMQGRRLGNCVKQYSISFPELESELQVNLAGLRQAAGGAELIEELFAGLQAQGAENVFAVAEALRYGGGGGAPGFGTASHGESFFSASCPQA